MYIFYTYLFKNQIYNKLQAKLNAYYYILHEKIVKYNETGFFFNLKSTLTKINYFIRYVIRERQLKI